MSNDSRITIIKPANAEQLKVACRLYMQQNDNTFMWIEPSTCEKNIVNHWMRQEYIRLIMQGNRIAGFILAAVVSSKHCGRPHMVQEYYCTDLKGTASARAVYLAHDDMLQEARRRRLPFVVSCGSHMDPTFVFARMLEKRGWKRRGHICIYDIDPMGGTRK